jgi:hypothetical protein
MQTKSFILILKEQHYSQLNGGTYYLLTWLDPETNEVYETSVDKVYANYKNWQTIVESKNYAGIYYNLKISRRTTKQNRKIISADSDPILELKLSDHKLLLLLELLQAKPKTTYDLLFQTQ